jgi:hypothetical protein
LGFEKLGILVELGVFLMECRRDSWFLEGKKGWPKEGEALWLLYFVMRGMESWLRGK